jgi:hypothetical protein
MKWLISILFSPGSTATALRTTPRWVIAFLVLAAISCGLRSLAQPYILTSTLAHLPASATEADKQVVIENLTQQFPATLAFLPIRLLLGWGTFAVALYYIAGALGPPTKVRFTHILALEVHSESTSVIANAASVVALMISPSGSLLTTPLSVASIVPSGSFVLNSLLTTLNIFTLWQIVIMTIGIKVMTGFGRIKSAIIVLLVWALSLLFTIGALKLVQDQMRLLLST